MSDARSNILTRLRVSSPGIDAPETDALPLAPRSREQQIVQFIRMLEAVRGSVIQVSQTDWQQQLQRLLQERGIKRLLIGPGAWPGSAIAKQPPPDIELLAYEQPVERWKESLFQGVDAAVTGARGAIAQTGTLVLWPSSAEPRLMSLVPPLHIVILNIDQLCDSFDGIIQAQHWTQGMPSNALLITGPSKSADIEQVLAYGVHGPKQLVVLLCE